MNDPILIIIFLMSGASAIVAFFKFQEKKKRIIENGIEVTGVGFKYSDNASLDHASPGNFEAAYPTIRFVTKEGLWITEQAEYAPSGLFVKEGQKITVIYNADNPKEFIYKSSIDLSKIGYLLLIIGIIAICIGLWFAYKYLTRQN